MVAVSTSATGTCLTLLYSAPMWSDYGIILLSVLRVGLYKSFSRKCYISDLEGQRGNVDCIVCCGKSSAVRRWLS